MKIANPTGKTLEEIQNNLAVHYPGLKIRKPFLGIGPQNLILPSGSLKHVIRPIKKNTYLVTDFIPPVLVIIGAFIASVFILSLILTLLLGTTVIGGIGGIGFILIFLLIKVIYKSVHKEKFEKFYTAVNLALTTPHHPDSIF